MNAIQDWPSMIVRAKGIAWIATRNNIAALLSQAGPSMVFEPAGLWVDAMDVADKAIILEEEPEIRERWDKEHGDRMTELVFIGLELNRKEIEAYFDQCLVTEEEMNQDWTTFNDPIPAWTDVVEVQS